LPAAVLSEAEYAMPGQRLDKWLYCSRLSKTRSDAAQSIAAGKVRVNGARALKASRLVREGDVVTAAFSGRLAVVRVIDIAARRVSAPLARGLYEDLTPPVPPDEAASSARGGPRPTKRDRRRLDAWRSDDL
jgi:ribosome-associated heat shock protein Hsp15